MYCDTPQVEVEVCADSSFATSRLCRIVGLSGARPAHVWRRYAHGMRTFMRTWLTLIALCAAESERGEVSGAGRRRDGEVETDGGFPEGHVVVLLSNK